MRGISFAKTWRPLTAEPTPTEAYVLDEFGEAIALAAGEWQRFETSNHLVDTAWADRFTLRQRVLAFLEGPIVAALQARFPKIGATGAEADALTETIGNTQVICRLIVGEAVIASGSADRAQARAALPD